MPPSSKINRPQTDLQKNHARRRRLKTIQKKKQKQRGKDPENKEKSESSITNFHRRRKRTDPHANVQPSNKKKRKLMKAMLRADKNKNAMQVEIVNYTSPRKRKHLKSGPEVEAMET